MTAAAAPANCGSFSNDFNTPGVREHAMKLETSADAQRFHNRLVNAFVRANSQVEPLRPEHLAWPSSAP